MVLSIPRQYLHTRQCRHLAVKGTVTIPVQCRHLAHTGPLHHCKHARCTHHPRYKVESAESTPTCGNRRGSRAHQPFWLQVWHLALVLIIRWVPMVSCHITYLQQYATTLHCHINPLQHTICVCNGLPAASDNSCAKTSDIDRHDVEGPVQARQVLTYLFCLSYLELLQHEHPAKVG